MEDDSESGPPLELLDEEPNQQQQQQQQQLDTDDDSSAEEAEEEDEEANKEDYGADHDSNEEIAPFTDLAETHVENNQNDDNNNIDDDDDNDDNHQNVDVVEETAVIHPPCNRSFVSETGDDGFAALAEEFAPFMTSPAKLSKKNKKKTNTITDDADDDNEKTSKKREKYELADVRTLSDPKILALEKNALEGPGTGQLRLELRSMEVTGMKLLKKTKNSEDYNVFLENLLKQHNRSSIKYSLKAMVEGKQRGEYLFNRLRRRLWTHSQSITTNNGKHTSLELFNSPLPIVVGEVTLQLPIEPPEALHVGAEIPSPQAKKLGTRAIGQVIPLESVKNVTAITGDGIEDCENVVVISAEALHMFSTNILSGSYGSYTAATAVTAVFVPAREGGMVTGIVAKIENFPNFPLNRPISKPLENGIAEVVIANNHRIPIKFGAEIPSRSAAVGRVWVSRLQRNKDRQWKLSFSLDPFITGISGDTDDAPVLQPKYIAELNLNRRPISTPQPSKNWTAATDLKTGWRVIKELPEAGFWNPSFAQDLYGTHVIRGVELTVSRKGFNKENVNHAKVNFSDHQVGELASQRAKIEVHYQGVKSESQLCTSYSKHHKKHAQHLCTLVARCIEATIILLKAGVEPKPRSLSFREGSNCHDDAAPWPSVKNATEQIKNAKSTKKRKSVSDSTTEEEGNASKKARGS